ncbi:sensor histidine kinase [Tranquillimonas alkanivorans]|uniref:histidine kinase n=1 Tax=Tranquillimonas alkanivorans TaxID=441119 RepID=A0A1I5QBF8_9RHOB|nr:HAMP domain-containing sensor histidine kinase [Tranquillimonas alkanivorans]SFP43654.1 Signal transduction histidine kinase [Tranquillimonas alkanivorans]
MKLYETLARRGWPRSYTGKILLVSFIGVHVPMIGAVTYVLLADSRPFSEQLGVLGAMLLATLVGTAGTMAVMHALLAPVRAATDAAKGYLSDRKTPRLPTRYDDGAGVLMASIQECITRLDGALTTAELQREQIAQDHAAKFRMLSGMRHDFRTPLTHILGFAELMKADAIGPTGGEAHRKFAATIGKSGRELLQTLQSVLDLSDAAAKMQAEEDRETLDLVDLATNAVSLEHLFAERRGVAVTLDAPETLETRAVRDVAKNLVGALLQAGIAGTPDGGRVTLEVSQRGGAAVAVESHGGKLFLEDVPPELAHLAGPLESGTGSQAATAETSTPMTLRISLIETLCRAVGARYAIAQTGDGWRMSVALDEPVVAPVPVAAE